jgi:hypothetical protein
MIALAWLNAGSAITAPPSPEPNMFRTVEYRK